MEKKKIVNNSFFDSIALLLSFVFSFFRSIKIFFSSNKNTTKKENLFFNFLDFIFRKWNIYFWEKPSVYKISSFFSDLLNSTFKNK
jgi:hypothetical protein